MNKEEREIFESIMNDSSRKEFENYNMRAEKYINSLDFSRLSEIKEKNINDVTQSDLIFLGFEKCNHEEFEELYAFRDFDSIKIYFNRVADGFEKRGFGLKKEQHITTVKELLENSLTDWKLRMNREFDNVKINWTNEPPF
jgi:predicted GNAT family acetyltransferase